MGVFLHFFGPQTAAYVVEEDVAGNGQRLHYIGGAVVAQTGGAELVSGEDIIVTVHPLAVDGFGGGDDAFLQSAGGHGGLEGGAGAVKAVERPVVQGGEIGVPDGGIVGKVVV